MTRRVNEFRLAVILIAVALAVFLDVVVTTTVHTEQQVRRVEHTAHP